jgi:hypothetical protein
LATTLLNLSRRSSTSFDCFLSAVVQLPAVFSTLMERYTTLVMSCSASFVNG